MMENEGFEPLESVHTEPVVVTTAPPTTTALPSISTSTLIPIPGNRKASSRINTAKNKAPSQVFFIDVSNKLGLQEYSNHNYIFNNVRLREYIFF